MIGSTLWRVLVLASGLALVAAPAGAQVALPGASSTAPSGADASSPKPKAAKHKPAKAKKSAEAGLAGVESIDGRPLMLNGGAGLLQISRKGDVVEIDKLSLAGEGVSDPSQKCVVNIVGEKPIVATGSGRPDGLERFEAEVPACPFAFEAVGGAALVPPQITACVFKAADCQTSPSGLWGPDGATLESDSAAIGKRRSDAEDAMAKALRALQARASDNPEAAEVVRDQAGFAGQRDDTCRDYVKEPAHGFCAASVTAARAALLEARLQALSGDKAEKHGKTASSGKPEKHVKHKKAKTDEAGAAEPAASAPAATAAQPQ